MVEDYTLQSRLRACSFGLLYSRGPNRWTLSARHRSVIEWGVLWVAPINDRKNIWVSLG